MSKLSSEIFSLRRFGYTLLWACLLSAGAVQAQEAANPIEFEIPAQDLAGALREFSRQTEIQLLYAPEDVKGQRSSALRGSHEALEALALLLKDTGLVARQTAPGTLILAPPGEPSPARAEPILPPPLMTTPMEQVVVTASRREKTVGELPMSVSVLTGPELEDSGLIDFTEIANSVPSAHLSGSTYTLRGLATIAPGGRAVDFLIDGATGSSIFFASNPTLLDFERIEVIRGSQGTLYGQNSLGGTIKLVSARPRYGEQNGEVEFRAWSQSGGDNSWQGSAVFNVPLGEGLAARLGVSHEDRGGFINNYTVMPVTFLPDELKAENVNTRERTAFRGALAWQASERLELYLTARRQSLTAPYFELETMWRDPPGGGRLVPFDDYRSTLNIEEYLLEPESEETIATLEAVYDFDTVSLTSETTSYEDERKLILLTIGGAQGLAERESQQNRSQEFRLVSRDDGRLEWILGAYWREEENRSRLELEDFSNGLVFRHVRTFDRSQVALYGNIRYRLSEKAALEAGLRWFEEDLDRYRIRETSLPGLARPPNMSDGAGSFDTLAPRLVLTYDLDDGTFVYGSVSKGFRGGVVNLGTDLPEPLQTSGPDTNWTYELGLKGRWLQDRLAGSVVLFYNDWQDIQVNAPVVFEGMLYNIAVNGESAHSKGLEWRLAWHPTETFSLSVGGHYMDSKLDTTVRGQQGPSIQDIRPGNELTKAPRYSLSFRAEMVRPLGSGREGYLGIELMTQGESYSRLNNEPVTRTPSHAQGTVRIGIRSGAWEVSAFAKNLWDERGYTSQGGSFGSDVLGFGQVIPPRRTGLSVKYRF